MTDERTFTQEEVNTLLGKVRGETRDRVKKEFEAELTKQKEDSERSKLAENQEYKLLSEKLQTQVTEQVGFKEQVEKYIEIMEGVLAHRLENMSDEAKAAVETLPGDVTVKLQWLNDNKALFETTGDGVGTPAGGTRSGGPKKSQFKPRGI